MIGKERSGAAAEICPVKMVPPPQELPAELVDASHSIIFAFNQLNYVLDIDAQIIHVDQYTRLEQRIREYNLLYQQKTVAKLKKSFQRIQELGSEPEACDLFMEVQIGVKKREDLLRVEVYLTQTLKLNSVLEWDWYVLHLERDDIKNAAPGITFHIIFRCTLSQSV